MLVGTAGYRLAHITVAQAAPSEIGSGADYKLQSLTHSDRSAFTS